MEIQRMSYIFGSFARRRQSRDLKARINHDRSNSTPISPKKHTTFSTDNNSISPLRTKSSSDLFPATLQQDDAKFKCNLCKKIFVEPKVLPCLHTFCLGCIEELALKNCTEDAISEGSSYSSSSSTTKGSNSDGSSSDAAKKSSSSSSSTSKRQQISCPTCNTSVKMPKTGPSAYPPNYLIQNHMILATVNAHTTHLLCDLCYNDATAIWRCMECSISLCDECVVNHEKIGHKVLSLKEARKRGITRVRKQAMCIKHPEMELEKFCATCCQVVCKACTASLHLNHQCESLTRALQIHLPSLKMASNRAKSLAEQSALAANRLANTTKHIEAQCNRVQADVEKFIENYVKDVAEHRERLIKQISENRVCQLTEVASQKEELHRKVREARDVSRFLEELLEEGSDVEVLTFVKPVLQRIKLCDRPSPQLLLSDSMQFRPEETAPSAQSTCPLYGVITTQSVVPSNCTLTTEGLNNLRVGRRAEAILETRDRHNSRLERGGERVSAEIRYRDGGVSKMLDVEVDDRRDGTYLIAFEPDIAGKVVLSVRIKDQPIKNSPFPIVVRNLKPHLGTFHCCCFCSSSGSKEAICGCGGKMVGGYKGCGHGHMGHPGRRHWSCCGSILEHSECTRTISQNNSSNSYYQFTL